MLSSTAKTNICSILEALVNGGAVRPEDSTSVQTALADLKAGLVADEAALADHETRISALEDLANGEETALKPAPAAPAPAADPAPAATTETGAADPAPSEPVQTASQAPSSL